MDPLQCYSDISKNSSVITAPGVAAFREFVLFAHNGIRMLDKAGNLIKTTEEGEPHGAHGEVDHEDTGEKGFNNRSERFYNHFRRIPLAHKLFDSKVQGEPATPVLKAYTGERVILRYLMPGDKPRNTAFLIHGHTWREQPDNPLSNVEAVKGAISVGNVYNLELLGGTSDCPGDYLYRSGALRWDVESGMWDMLRIKTRTAFSALEAGCRNARQWWEKLWRKA